VRCCWGGMLKNSDNQLDSIYQADYPPGTLRCCTILVRGNGTC
jgi:hypothetical protein